MKRTDCVPAVVYYRMSSDDQSTSIDVQKSQVERLIEQHRYKVVQVYVDEGKSGSKDQEKRAAFQQLLADSNEGRFRVVVCYNAARFARLDSIDGAFAKQILRGNNVSLHTVMEGVIDWRTEQGRMMDFMLSEHAHKYSRDLAALSVAGRLRTLKAGHWCHGAVPFGFDRLYRGGGQQHLIPRTSTFRKPRGWTLDLVVNENEAAIVRRIFDEFVNQAQSMRRIAARLNAEMVPPPDNLPRAQKLGWTNITVAGILRHKAYIGVGASRTRYGKPTAKTAFSRMEEAEVEGCCPALVPVALFQAAQDLLRKNQERKARQQPSRCGPLSGFAFCGHCGYAMCKEQRGDGPIKYVCRSSGRTPSGCPQWSATQEVLLPKAIRAVADMIDAELLRQLDSPDDSQARTELLAKQVESLTAQHERARKRFLMVEDDDLARELQVDLLRMKAEVEAAQEALHLARAVQPREGITDFAAWWRENKPILMALSVTATYPDGRQVTRVSCPLVKPDPNSEVIRAEPPRTREELLAASDLKIEFVPFDLDRFRGLLTRLGLRLVCRWQESARRQGNGRHELAEVTVGIDVNHSLPDTSAKRNVVACTGTC